MFIAASSCKLIFVMFLVVLFVQKVEKLISLHKLFSEAKFSTSAFKDQLKMLTCMSQIPIVALALSPADMPT